MWAFLAGLASIFDLSGLFTSSPITDKYRHIDDGEAFDREQLENDWRVISKDMDNVFDRYTQERHKNVN